jgi:hypothetical protein
MEKRKICGERKNEVGKTDEERRKRRRTRENAGKNGRKGLNTHEGKQKGNGNHALLTNGAAMPTSASCP